MYIQYNLIYYTGHCCTFVANSCMIVFVGIVNCCVQQNVVYSCYFVSYNCRVIKLLTNKSKYILFYFKLAKNIKFFSGSHIWSSKRLTQDHKPESKHEKLRINNSGGKVMSKRGVQRVVWNRPKIEHRGPVRRSTPIDEIPFLAVARSLGDLWSYNSELNEFIVSPKPDVKVIEIDESFRCLIFGTDGLWNMFSPTEAVEIVNLVEEVNEECQDEWINPSTDLIEICLKKWNSTNFRADNISVITILLYPPKDAVLGATEIDFDGQYSMNGLENSKSIIQGSNMSVTITDEYATLYDHSTNERFPLDDSSFKDIKVSKLRKHENKSRNHESENIPYGLSILNSTKETEKSLACDEYIPMNLTKELSIDVDPQYKIKSRREKENFNQNDSVQIRDIKHETIQRTMQTRKMTKVNCRVTRSKIALNNFSKKPKDTITLSTYSNTNTKIIKRKKL